MKRLLWAALAVLCVTSTASANGVLHTQLLQWRFPANVTSAPFTQPTKPLAAGGTDTTIWVSTQGWIVPEQPAADTVVVGRFLVFVDSSLVYAPGQTTLTSVVDGAVAATSTGAINAALINVNQQSLYSLTQKPTTGDKIMSVPIFMLANHINSNGNWQGLAPIVRLRISSSAAINAAGIAVQWLSSPNLTSLP